MTAGVCGGLAGTRGLADAVHDRRQVPEYLERLELSVAAASSAVDELVEIVRPVLRDGSSPVMEGEVDPPEVLLVGVAASIRARCRELDALAKRIHDVRSRVEL